MSPARWRQFGCNLARVRPISTCCVLRAACCLLRACCLLLWRCLALAVAHSALCTLPAHRPCCLCMPVVVAIFETLGRISLPLWT